jgi:hypothetical protein
MRSYGVKSFTISEQLQRIGLNEFIWRKWSTWYCATRHSMLVFDTYAREMKYKAVLGSLVVLSALSISNLMTQHQNAEAPRMAIAIDDHILRDQSVMDAKSVAPVKSKLDQQQMILSDVISGRYRIAHEASEYIVKTTFSESRKFDIDPVLMLALMAIESRFNPISESVVGAQGFSQVLPKYHQEKIKPIVKSGGHLLDMSANIHVGMQILREYMIKFHNNEVMALQQYNGTLHDKTRKYSKKVLGEKRLFLAAIESRKVVQSVKPVMVAQMVKPVKKTPVKHPKIMKRKNKKMMNHKKTATQVAVSNKHKKTRSCHALNS